MPIDWRSTAPASIRSWHDDSKMPAMSSRHCSRAKPSIVATACRTMTSRCLCADSNELLFPGQNDLRAWKVPLPSVLAMPLAINGPHLFPSHRMKSEIEFASHPANLPRVRDFVRQFLKPLSFSETEKDLIILGLDEACTNVVRYPYHQKPDQLICPGC